MECWANDTSGAARKKLVTRTIASPITRMDTSVEDGWRESSRPRGVRVRVLRLMAARRAALLPLLSGIIGGTDMAPSLGQDEGRLRVVRAGGQAQLPG
jgi:hypothetical protein